MIRADGLVTVRRARTSDVPAMKALVDIYSGQILLEKNLVTLYEAVQEFWVAELDGELIGCGALHVLWSDLGEVRTVAVHPKVRGRASGTRSSTGCWMWPATCTWSASSCSPSRRVLQPARLQGDRGYAGHREVYEEMCRSYDTGVAEFLDLSYVKPNILGNTRMLLTLEPRAR